MIEHDFQTKLADLIKRYDAAHAVEDSGEELEWADEWLEFTCFDCNDEQFERADTLLLLHIQNRYQNGT